MKNHLNSYENLDPKFISWLAGIIDGDGNFDVRKGNVLKAIRIKLHNRDIRILYRILNILKVGRIKSIKNKPYSMYIVSNQEQMKFICHLINGQIRLKVPGFIKSCHYLNIPYIEANYSLKPYDPYYSGLIDTEGSIVFNYSCNRIECNLELKYNDYSKKLDLSNLIPFSQPYIIKRAHNNRSLNKTYYSISFKYQNVDQMIHIYDFFIKNRLYSDFKFYRVTRIKSFILLRKFKNDSFDSIMYKKYSQFVKSFIQYENPSWTKLSYINKLNL